MSNTMSKPGLDPIEHASQDELRALQLERLKWSLKHAYENVPHYKKAFEQACYRAGHQVKDIISEASCLSAFLPKERVFLKQLKHVGITLGLYRKPEAGSVIEDWELDQLALQLPLEFPECGRFAECQQDLANEPSQGWLFIEGAAIAK